MSDRGIGGHHRGYQGKKDEWLTPPEIVEALGPFDLDPCAATNQPWKTAYNHYIESDDGLSREWRGRVWMNPPYGPNTAKWLARLSDHGNGMALIFARTETDMWFRYIWDKADALLFIQGRLHFYHADGRRAANNTGAPSALVAYSAGNTARLEVSGIDGKFIRLT